MEKGKRSDLCIRKRKRLGKLSNLQTIKYPMGFKFIFKVKHIIYGRMNKFNALLIVKDFNRFNEIDYKEVFAPLAS